MSTSQTEAIRSELHADDKRIKRIAFGVALLFHGAVLFISFPEIQQVVPDRPDNAIYVQRIVPQPPPVELREIPQLNLQRKIFVPDPTPEAPEPIHEPVPEIRPEQYPPDVTFIIGPPPPPPVSSPLVVDGLNVTSPVRIEASAVKPIYPEIARLARVEGRVIVQAVILEDGTVADVTVLNCTQPGMGFEEEAIEAVLQWRYRPAMQGNRPVDVYFTVVVLFELS